MDRAAAFFMETAGVCLPGVTFIRDRIREEQERTWQSTNAQSAEEKSCTPGKTNTATGVS
jgi:hypothetical protein